MIEYQVSNVKLQCFLKDNYVHFYCNNILFESTYKKITNESDIPRYLDSIFADEQQVHALIYAVEKSPNANL